MTLADCRRPLFACRMIYRSSPAVVYLERPPPTFQTAVFVVWNAFQVREKKLLLIPNSAATLVTETDEALTTNVNNPNNKVVQYRSKETEDPVFIFLDKVDTLDSKIVRSLMVVQRVGGPNHLKSILKMSSYTRAFGDGPRNFEPWSWDVDDTLAGTPSPNYHTTPTGGRFSSRQI
ncbi:hypothetical protein TNCV_1802341 [Trichonephila clavipes]|nr:hypothetical protein TNCV_1802341 [Trichonephila clavipes]